LTPHNAKSFSPAEEPTPDDDNDHTDDEIRPSLLPRKDPSTKSETSRTDLRQIGGVKSGLGTTVYRFLQSDREMA